MIDNKILALKYRPQEFKDLIGQEVIAQTITNAIRLGKTPNAYLLTGIRGVGKTTTARLIAKALNCLENSDSNKKCKPGNFCASCNEIVNSNHIDILEMDAASKTGIDDIRELIENSKYSPTSAKYKIFIIDEVHMLSKQAFNGLLKTLEEPPPRLKFILATTEVRKIPVTILSRCQRFDLKRAKLDQLFDHLKKIGKLEKGNISDDALKLIARASEGSVRDAVSLLDRTLIFQSINSGKQIVDKDVRKMLGLADKSKLMTLFKEILLGNQKNATSELKELIENGLDSKNFLNDILEILYLFSRRLNLGEVDKDMMLSEAEIDLLNNYTQNLDMQDISLFWQLTIKTIDDLKIVSNENLTLEMYVLQLMHLKGINKNELLDVDTKSVLNENEGVVSNKEKTEIKSNEKKITNLVKSQMKNVNQIKENIEETSLNENKNFFEINNFEDLIKTATKEKEVELRYDLERNVKLLSFSKGKIDICFNEKLNKNFIKLLTEKLLTWTGKRWVISLSKNKDNGLRTLHEQKIESENLKVEDAKNSNAAKKLLSAFPDADLVKIKEEEDA